LSAVPIAIACASAGIIAGILSMTGLGSKFSTLIIHISGGIPLVALLLTMVASLILGMGLPTTAAYLILATVVAPALVKLGVPLLTAHMFVFFFGCISTITPPVALASYVAAGISNASIDRVSWTAFRFGLASFILPFMFFWGPALLLQGTWTEIIYTVIMALIGIFAIASSIVGYLNIKINLLFRFILFVAGTLMVYQGVFSDILGIVVLFIIYILTKRISRKVIISS
ncbi:MAG TPA: TRAP transporter large permease subunit, partial [Candidatus Atribacteria bacterium]|nr:TRAP transporter large permease subunit [Candidatus Atribacteria bacterium]